MINLTADKIEKTFSFCFNEFGSVPSWKYYNQKQCIGEGFDLGAFLRLIQIVRWFSYLKPLTTGIDLKKIIQLLVRLKLFKIK